MSRSGCCPYPYSAMNLNYPDYRSHKQEPLYRTWGLYGQAKAVHEHGLGNSCAVRMSLCLLKCGMQIPWPAGHGGAWTIRRTPPGWKHLKGKKVLVRVGSPLPKRGLADVLTQQWGKPDQFGTYERSKWKREARGTARLSDVVDTDDLKEQAGVIAYYGLPPRPGRVRYPGHIDIIHVDANGRVQAGGNAYLPSDYVLLWPLCTLPLVL